MADNGGGVAFPLNPLPLLQALRPWQWVKNLLVFLPFVFAINLVWWPDNLTPAPGLLLRAALTAAAFCALSGAVYLFNDLMDRAADREHPTKRFRPVAAGRVGAATAIAALVILLLAGLGLLAWLTPLLGGVGLLYLAINLSYSLGLKRLPLLDALLVSSGYVIRPAAGAVAIGVAPSPWLYTTMAALALFIVLGKRYAEARLAGDSPENQRPVLRHYPRPFVGQLLTIAAAAALISYGLYTVEAPNLPANNAMLLTIPPVVYGLFRFLYLLHTSRYAEYPELLILKDWPVVLSMLAWIGAATVILFLNS